MTNNNDLKNWKLNAEENYTTTPISVLKYITELEKSYEDLADQKINRNLGIVLLLNIYLAMLINL
jgi:hypothetical protein